MSLQSLEAFNYVSPVLQSLFQSLPIPHKPFIVKFGLFLKSVHKVYRQTDFNIDAVEYFGVQLPCSITSLSHEYQLHRLIPTPD